MIKKLLFLLILFNSYFAISQDEDYVVHLPKYAIGISMSSFLNPNEGIQVSQDFGLNDNINLSLETGYIYASYYRNRDVSGYRIRPVAEYYFNRTGESAFGIGVFGLYRNIEEKYSFEVSHNEDRYREKVPTSRSKILRGGGIQLGMKFKVSSKVLLDIGLGFGSGVLEVKDLSENQEIDRRFVFFGWSNYDTVGSWQYPILYYNLNVSYKLF